MTTMDMGVPNVRPSKRPDNIWQRSSSCREVTIELCPGRRRSNSNWISDSLSSICGGQPSMTAPTPPPCDSPQVVTRKSCPKLLAISIDCRFQISDLRFQISDFRLVRAFFQPENLRSEILIRLDCCQCCP